MSWGGCSCGRAGCGITDWQGDDDGDDGGTGRGVQVDGGLVLMGLPFQGSMRVGGKGSGEIGCGIHGPCILFWFVCK